MNCTPIAGGLGECNGSFMLEDGEIETEGSDAGNDERSADAIVGGTGAYRGATGSAETRFRSDGRASVTLDLLIPSE